ncbi:MAG: hypothetical protein HPY44_03935 [Armatimonadetes bacterium]|nr:hypothetical protein [Armatimonadota bacterium]
MRLTVVVLTLITIMPALHAQGPLLDRLRVHSTGPVTVTVPLADAPEGSVFLANDGSWKSLPVAYEGGRATFSLPDEAAGNTTVILRVPQWLNLKDADDPVIARLEVDGADLAVAPEVDLGNLRAAPGVVKVVVDDAGNPVDAGSAAVSLNGVPLSREQVRVLPLPDTPHARLLEISLGDLEPERYTLRLRVPDAAATPHFADLTLRFSTAPLVVDGGFEKLTAEGNPAHWITAMWSTTPETKAELKVVEGGHSGKYCAEIKGIAGGLNLLFGQEVFLTGGRTYKVSGYYKADTQGAYTSLIADGKEQKEQYLSSPRLAPVEDWTPFEWQFSVKPAEKFTLYLRNGATGSVWWDDVVLEEVGKVQ